MSILPRPEGSRSSQQTRNRTENVMVCARVGPCKPVLDYWIPDSGHCPENTDDEYSEGEDVILSGPDSYAKKSRNKPNNQATPYTQTDDEREMGNQT